MAENINFLKEVTGLEKDDLRIYGELLRHGFGTVSYLSVVCDLKDKKVAESLGRLDGKKLIKKIPGVVDRYIPLRPYAELVKYLETFYTEAENQQKRLKDFQVAQETQLSQASGDLNAAIEKIQIECDQNLGTQQESSRTAFDQAYVQAQTKTEATANAIPDRIAQKLAGVIDQFLTTSNEKKAATAADVQAAINHCDGALSQAVTTTQTQIGELEKQAQAAVQALIAQLKQDLVDGKTDFTTKVTGFLKTTEDALSGFLANVSVNKQTVEAQVQQTLADVHTGFSEMENEFKSEWTTFKSGLNSTVQNANAMLTAEADGFQNQFSGQVQQVTATTTKTIENDIKSLQGDLAQLQQASTAKISSTIEKATKLLNQLASDQSAAGDGTQSKITADVTALIASNIQANDQLAQDTKANLNAAIDAQISQLNSATEKFKARIKTEADREVARFKSEAQKLLSGNIDAYIKKLGALAQDLSNNFKEQINSFVVDVDDAFYRTQKDLEEKFGSQPELVQGASGFLTGATDKLKKAQAAFKNSLTDAISKDVVKLQSEGKAALQELQNQYILQVEAQGETYQRAFKDEVATVITGIESQSAGIKKKLTDQVDQKVGTQKAQLESHQASTIKALGDQLSTFKASTGQALHSITDAVCGDLKDTDTSIVELLSQKGASLSATLTQVTAEVGSTLSALQSGAAVLIQKFKTEIPASLSAGVENFTAQGNSIQEKITTLLTGKYSEFKSATNAATATNVKVPEITTGALNEAVRASEAATIGTLDAAERKIIETATTHTEKWKGIIESFQPGVQPVIDELKAKNTATLTALIDQLTAFQAQVEQVFKASTETVATVSGAELKGIEADLKATLDTVHTQISKMFGELAAKIKEITAIAKKGTIENLTATESAIAAKIKEVFAGIDSLIAAIVIASKKPLTILKESWMGMLATPLLAIENTWMVAGQQGIMTYLRELVDRTQKSIHLVIPDLDSVEIKDLQNMTKKGGVVHIVTNLQKGKKSKPEKLVEKGIHVYDSQTEDFIAAVRDGQEVILAPNIADKLPDQGIELGEDAAGIELEIPGDLRKKMGEKAGIASVNAEFATRMTKFFEILESQAKKL
jgi:sugar-specific transcriptional regulator TrmB